MNRFLTESPEAKRIVDSYDELLHIYRVKAKTIGTVTTGVVADILHKNIQPRDFSIHAENRLNQVLPEFTEKVDSLRHDLTALDNKDITWWTCIGPSSVRRNDLELINGIMDGTLAVETGQAYAKDEGRVLGSLVGFNTILQSFGIWVEVAPISEIQKGINYPFMGMYAIELV